VDGAEPGILINADPRVTDSHRQEYLAGEAEDMYWVIAIDGTVTVPYGRFDGAVTTFEWTPLEPQVVSQKIYVAGVGLVSEANVAGPLESGVLVDVSGP
jgi:hypothetical protein